MNKIILPEGFSVEERRERAMSCFRDGGFNCCQAVVLAFADVLESNSLCNKDILAMMGSGFGGGMGRLREVCGSFSGMVMMAGFISPADKPQDMDGRTANYALVQEFAQSFKDVNGGSIICRELLGLVPRPQVESPVPSDRTPDYYKKRPCVETVGNAAALVAAKLLYIRDKS